MMRKKFWPLIFSRVRMAANTSAKAKVIRVTVTTSRIIFCMERMNWASCSRCWKFLSPTKVSLGE